MSEIGADYSNSTVPETIEPSQTPMEPQAPAPMSPPEPFPAPTASHKACRHCGASFAIGLKTCPACGLTQRGRPKGEAPKTAPIEKKVLTEEEIDKVADALADTVDFVISDFLAPIVIGKDAPSFGEARARRVGHVWAPILAPYINGSSIAIILALAVTAKAFGGYYRECQRCASNQNNA